MKPTTDYKLGINALSHTGLAPDAHIGMLQNMGWDGFFTTWTPENTGAYAAAARDHGMVYTSIHAPFHGTRAMWELDRTTDARIAAEAATDTLLDCLRDCAAHGIPVMVAHTFIGFDDHTVTEEGLAHFGRLVDEAERLGVTVAFENVEGMEYLAAVMNAFGDRPSVGFCFDSEHELCYNPGHDMLALYGDKLVHTHINDNLGISAGRSAPDATGHTITWLDDLHLVMGDGIVDFPSVMRRLEACGYNGILTCEMSLTNKPGGHTHDGYIAMGIENFYRLCLDRMRGIVGPADREVP